MVIMTTIVIITVSIIITAVLTNTIIIDTSNNHLVPSVFAYSALISACSKDKQPERA